MKKTGLVISMISMMILSFSQAELLVYEGFDYTVGSSNPASWNGGEGFSGAWWTTVPAGTHSAEITEGLTFSTLQTSGGAVKMDSLTDLNGTVRNFIAARTLDANLESGTLWVSYLIARTSGHSSNGNQIRVMQDGTTTRDFTAEYKALNSGGIAQLHLGGTTQGGSGMSPGNRETPYLVVASYETGKADAAANLWILDEADYAAIDQKILEGTVSVADLDANNVYKVELTGGGSITLDDTDVLQILHQSRATNEVLVATYDELRMGTTLASVIPTTAEPEPELPEGLLVYEGFDYTVGSSNPAAWNGGAGFSGAWWTSVPAGTHSAEITEGLTFSTLQTSGGAVKMDSLTDLNGTVRNFIAARTLDANLESGTLWVSYLIARTSGHSSNGNQIRVMHDGTTTRDFTAEYKALNSGGIAQLHLGGTTQGGSGMSPGNRETPYLVVASYETGKADAAANLWILDAADYAAIDQKILEGTVSAADLDANNVYKVELTGGGSITLDDTDVLQILHQSRATNEVLVAIYDELRVGTALHAVIPTTGPAEPEPELPEGLLVYEGFSYTVGSSNPASWNGGAGFSGAWWTSVPAGTHSAEITEGLTFSTLQTSGGAVKMDSLTDLNGTGRNFIAARTLDANLESGTLWVSYLIARTSGHSSNANIVRMMDKGSSTRDWTAEYKAFHSGGIAQLHLGGTTQGGSGMSPGNREAPYLVVASYEIGKTEAEANLWILDEADYAAIDQKILAGTVSAADLDANNVYKVELTGGGSITLDDTDVLQILHSSRMTNEVLIATYDELRIGTALHAVIPTTAEPLDEPAVISSMTVEPDNGSLVVRIFFDEDGETYTLQRSLDLTSGVWSNLTTGTDGTLSDTNEFPQAFYRLMRQE